MNLEENVGSHMGGTFCYTDLTSLGMGDILLDL